MDPSASDFVMHQRSNSLDRPGLMYPSVPQQGHLSPCPALRAAAAEELQAQAAAESSSRSGTHYDPVHGSSSSWWQQNQHRHQHQHHHQHHHPPPQPGPHTNWQPPVHFTRAPYLFQSAFPGILSSPGAPMPGGLPQGQPQPGAHAHASYHPNYSTHSHSHTHSPAASIHTPPAFNHHAAFPNLNLIGGTAPGQHSQANVPGNSTNTESHAARPPRLPGVHPFTISPGPNLVSHASPNPPSSNMPSHAFSASPERRPHEEQPAYAFDMFAREPNGQYTLRDWSPPRDLPPPAGLNELPRLSTSTSNLRRPGPTFQHSSPEGSSDEDMDAAENEAGFLEVVTGRNTGMAPYLGSEERLRAQQLMRGSVPGKRVASRRAIESLLSVEISGLSESERTCVICYNDFGVENPEGINEAPLRLPKCKHVFGDHCIKKWFEESDSCPYCRDKVPSEPLRQSSIVAFFRNNYNPQAFAQRMGRDAANAQLRSGGGPADGARGGAFSPLGEFYDAMGGTYMHRRPEGSSLRASWQSSPGRRSPSSDLNDNRRRTRPRHGSLRGSPPSARATSYAAASSGGNQMFFRAYNTAQTRPVALPSPPDPERSIDAARFENIFHSPSLGHPHAHLAHAGASSEQARNRNAPETADVASPDLNSSSSPQ